MADCIRALHPDKAYQHAANEVCLRVGNLVESLNTDVDLYDAAVRAVHAQTSATPSPEIQTDFVDKRVLNLFVEDFEQSGVHLKDVSDRQTFLKAASRNLELGVEFNRVIYILKSPIPFFRSPAHLLLSTPPFWAPFQRMWTGIHSRGGIFTLPVTRHLNNLYVLSVTLSSSVPLRVRNTG